MNNDKNNKWVASDVFIKKRNTEFALFELICSHFNGFKMVVI